MDGSLWSGWPIYDYDLAFESYMGHDAGMAPSNKTKKSLARLFTRKPIADLAALRRQLDTTSRRTVYRALASVGYWTSYSHAGRYYTLKEIPRFDQDGVWACGDVLFSRHGTLRATIVHMVGLAPAGQTHAQLQARLRLRVHDTLHELVERGDVGRIEVNGLFLYVSPDREKAESQVTARRQLVGTGGPPSTSVPEPSVIIDILLVVIHHPKEGPVAIATRLAKAGKSVGSDQVEGVFARYALGEKKLRSRRSPR
jgi:hypothetical protein